MAPKYSGDFDYLEEYGQKGKEPFVKKVTDELWERVVDGNEYLVNVSVDFFKDSGDRLDIIETDYKTYWIIKKEKRMCKTDIYNYAIKVLGLTPDRFGVYDGETKIQIRVEDWKK